MVEMLGMREVDAYTLTYAPLGNGEEEVLAQPRPNFLDELLQDRPGHSLMCVCVSVKSVTMHHHNGKQRPPHLENRRGALVRLDVGEEGLQEGSDGHISVLRPRHVAPDGGGPRLVAVNCLPELIDGGEAVDVPCHARPAFVRVLVGPLGGPVVCGVCV